MRPAERLSTIQEYYFSKKLKEVKGLVSSGRPIINLGIGSPDLMPPDGVVETLHDATNEKVAHKYQSYQGIPELRQAMSSFYSNWFNVKLDPNSEILPLMGSKEGIMHISLAFLNTGDQVLIPNPGYPTYTSVTNLVGGIPIYYDLKEENQWQPDLDKLEQLDLTKVKIMWVNYPHMPTGTRIESENLRELIRFAKENEILLVNDNPYALILNDDPRSLLEFDDDWNNVMELNSISKSFNMAGWRVGMVLGNESNINQVLKVKSNMDSGMFYPVQKGAIAALESSKQWFENLNQRYAKRRKLVCQLANMLNCEYEKEAPGMFVWAKLPNNEKTSVEYIDGLLEDFDLFIAPGSIFGSNGEGYVRFSLCQGESVIEEAIKRVGSK